MNLEPATCNLSLYLSLFRGRKVLVTGHTGFKGSWLSIWLHELGAEVHGVALDPPTNPSLFERAGVEGLVSDNRLDIRDWQALGECVGAIQPEIIFHLAAQPLVRESYRLARETYEINVMGSVHVFEAARNVSSVKALVHVATDKVYENDGRPEGYHETDPLGGYDPYSASKGSAEIAFQSWLRSYFYPANPVRAASGRAGNVIGGGDWAGDRIVPDIVRALEKGDPIAVRNPHATRPWEHVLEALSGYLTLGASLLKEEDKATGSWNFGPAAEGVHNVKTLVESMITSWGSGSWIKVGTEDNLHEAEVLTLNIDKARDVLGWTPAWDFKTTVQRTADWYRDFLNGQSALELCRRDIKAFMSK